MSRTSFTPGEINEIKGLLEQFPMARRAVKLMSRARLRRMGLEVPSEPQEPQLASFEQRIADGTITIDNADTFRAVITPRPPEQVFRVAVGVTGNPIDEDWNAFNQRFQWFGKEPKQVQSGAHLFVLAVDRWKSAVVGLYQAVSPGAVTLPGSPDPNRWPYALGVRPLAAVSPHAANRVEGQRGPQSGLPEHVYDAAAQDNLYAAIASSPPPPGPRTLEQRVQELEPIDVEPDVLQAVRELGRQARLPAVVGRAFELGGWNADELDCRAWYTGMGPDSHIHNITVNALRLADGKRIITKIHGVYSVVGH